MLGWLAPALRWTAADWNAAGAVAMAGLLACALSPVVARAAATYPALAYGTVNGHDLLLDLYLPPASAGATPIKGWPVVFWLHPGGWAAGDRTYFPPEASGLLDRGMAVASVDYRLTTQASTFGAEAVAWPAQLHDCKAAIRFLRGRASDFHLNPERVGAYGQSAGGHLAAMLATTGDSGVADLEGTVGAYLAKSSKVSACVDASGPADLLHWNDDATTPPGLSFDQAPPNSFSSMLLGYSGPGQGVGDLLANVSNPAAPYPRLVALAASASPVTYASANAAPMLVIHGQLDDVVPWKQSLRLRNALVPAGASVQLTLAPTGDHSSLLANNAFNGPIFDFLSSRLVEANASATQPWNHYSKQRAPVAPAPAIITTAASVH